MRQLAVEHDDPHEEMALDCSDIQNGEVDEAPLRVFNWTCVIEDDVIMGLRHFEDEGPRSTPITRCKSD